ncbi:hypothetical protein HN709_00415, partial [Candidatus Peregrinibacteria bacterium]|nr:hypothetical protein [Candidatus Peregrinibacteria bacterium]
MSVDGPKKTPAENACSSRLATIASILEGHPEADEIGVHGGTIEKKVSDLGVLLRISFNCEGIPSQIAVTFDELGDDGWYDVQFGLDFDGAITGKDTMLWLSSRSIQDDPTPQFREHFSSAAIHELEESDPKRASIMRGANLLLNLPAFREVDQHEMPDAP